MAPDLAHPHSVLDPRLSGAAVGTPSGFYVTGEDALRLTTFNSAAGVTLSMDGRLLDFEGRVVSFAERHVPNTDRTSASSLYRLGEGWLQNVQIRASGGTPRRGQCFVLLELVRGLTGAVIPLATLVQGYVTDTQRRAWPGSPVELSTEGPGVLRSIAGTDPAANTEISETVPTNARWRVHALDFTLVTDANAANREVVLVFDDGAAIVARSYSGVAQAASLTRAYSAFHHATRVAAAAALAGSIPLPRIDLPGGSRVRTLTTALQATDNYGAPQLLVEEWIED